MDEHGDIIIYQTEDGLTKIEVSFENDTVWLSKSQMAELFQRDRSVISKHIKNVFEEGELSQESNVQNLHIANSGIGNKKWFKIQSTIYCGEDYE